MSEHMLDLLYNGFTISKRGHHLYYGQSSQKFHILDFLNPTDKFMPNEESFEKPEDAINKFLERVNGTTV